MNRRRFLLLSSATLSGLLLPTNGLITLSRKFIIDLNGSCSFCGKHSREVFGLAGVTGMAPRICDECIQLCVDIVAEESMKEAALEPPPVHDNVDSLEELLAHLESDGIDTEPIRESLASMGEPSPPPQSGRSPGNWGCSFCGRPQDQVRKLVAGPSVFTCDECVFEAYALFTRARTLRL